MLYQLSYREYLIIYLFYYLTIFSLVRDLNPRPSDHLSIILIKSLMLCQTELIGRHVLCDVILNVWLKTWEHTDLNRDNEG